MIPQYLSELLLRFDTVILPGLGLFQLKNIPASINGDQILPPGKILLFDSSVKNNDGVLANYISEKKRISFFDACAQILEFVEKVQENLDAGNDVPLEKLGVLRKEKSGAILFTADSNIDYNIDSFGLTSITAAPLTKTQENLPGKKKRFPIAAVWIIAIVLFLGAGAAAVYFLKPGLLKEIGFNTDKQTEQENRNDTVNNKSQTNSEKNIQTQQQDSVKYYIIAESFRIKENADNYVIQLNRKGNLSESIFLPEKNLYVVSYNVYHDKTQAEQALAGFQSSGNPAAWILEK